MNLPMMYKQEERLQRQTLFKLLRNGSITCYKGNVGHIASACYKDWKVNHSVEASILKQEAQYKGRFYFVVGLHSVNAQQTSKRNTNISHATCLLRLVAYFFVLITQQQKTSRIRSFLLRKQKHYIRLNLMSVLL